MCAVHCLNNLLQNSYFTPVDLGSLASQLDEEERSRLAEGGIDSDDYRRFLAVSASFGNSMFIKNFAILVGAFI